MSTPEVELRSAWHHLAGPQHAHPLDHLLEDLLALHRQPHRHYHTATHVMWVLRHIDHILDAGSHPAVDVATLRLAALCHDAVYHPQQADNEALSAELAARLAVELGWAGPRVAAVRRLVLATATHTPSADDEAVLVDADLAILGADPNDYRAYVIGVRAEYAHVSSAQWATGRAAVLHRFLDSPAVFHTAVMHREREARARANLTAELAGLR